jgi:hypothetical protein
VDLWRDTVTGPFLPWRYRAAVTDTSAETTDITPAAEVDDLPVDDDAESDDSAVTSTTGA